MVALRPLFSSVDTLALIAESAPHSGGRSSTLHYFYSRGVWFPQMRLLSDRLRFRSHARERPSLLWFAAVIALGNLVLLPLDRFYDARFRKLRKLHRDTHAP